MRQGECQNPDRLLFLERTAAAIVWQLDEMADFDALLARQEALAEDRKVLRVRFDDHEISHRFEAFTREIYFLLEEQEEETVVMFDCLSLLRTAWATDLMMVNFFLVIIPVLKRRGLRAHFPLLRAGHSDHALRQIRDHADLFVNVWSDFRHIYLKAEKLPGPDDPGLLRPFILEDGLRPVRDENRQDFERAVRLSADRQETVSMDSWDRFFDEVRRRYMTGEDISADCVRMCGIMMTRDERMRELIIREFTPEDYFYVKEHMVGTGLIGGKACGMLAARKLVENSMPDLFDRMEFHDSFYIASDVYYTFLVENDLWDLRVRQRDRETYFSAGKILEEKLRTGVFSENIRSQLKELLACYGRSPIIVRSSSILEDGFGHAFAGKYESVFCPNTGSLEERLADIEEAIRVVYASSMSLSALDYRMRHGLELRDEQMALLVQKVSGSCFGSYYMPCAAGVGYSCSPYRFLPELDPAAGMLRLVMGLGTTAVDRTEGSYPRLVSLDRPEATPYMTAAQRHRYSQRRLEAINVESRKLELIPQEKVGGFIPVFIRRYLYEHDLEAEQRLRERGDNREVTFVSCRGLARNRELMDTMSGMLKAIQDGYEHPVDVEFTINLFKGGAFLVNLLQCRPLQVRTDDPGQPSLSIPDIVKKTDPADILLWCEHASMGLSRDIRLDYIIYIDPVAYYELPYADKPAVARILSGINWDKRGKGKKIMLLTPGRIGTSSPELGVPTAFSDISECSVICELSETRAGYRPELSYGSHIFQDLVEADILYTAVFENERTKVFDPAVLERYPLENFTGTAGDLPGTALAAVRLYSTKGSRLVYDMNTEQVICICEEPA